MSRRLARRATRVLWVLGAVGALLVLVKFFVADVYRVDSGSMRPTIFGGRARPDEPGFTEWVLVLYDDEPELARFDLAVMRSREGSAPLVKRVTGLPGETIGIADGDLWIEGKRLPSAVPRPAPIVVFDERWLDVPKFFHFESERWREDSGEWVVAGADESPGSLMSYHPDLRDDYLDREHQRVPGLRQVNDGILELEFRLDADGGDGKLRFRLVEEGDTFEVVLESRRIALVRHSARTLLEKHEESGSVITEVPVSLETGRWYQLSFANVDNHLTLAVPELQLAIGHDYPTNEPHPGHSSGAERSIGSRVAFGAEACTARFRSVRILRDPYYTAVGTFGVEAPLALGPDEYFLLGDNSASSTDSRHFGPVHAHELLGRPVAIVWPDVRRLEGGRPTSSGPSE